MTFLQAVTQGITNVGDVMALFIKEPTIYFTAIAFVSAAVGVSRKLIPMKKR
jgi:hypothetical protein